MTLENLRSVRNRFLLTIGFLSLAIAIWIAYRTPATNYELSVYASTPAGFWIGVAVSILLAVCIGVWSVDRGTRGLGFLLGTTAIMAILTLPVIRNYFFYGGGDSLSHLGWGAEIATGVLNPQDLLYPGVHLIGIFTSEVTGYPLTRSFLYLPVLIFPLIFIIFTALCVRYIANTQWAIVVGLFSALLLLPINKISVHTVVHPSSQAILFLPFILFLVFIFLFETSDRSSLTTPIGLLLTTVCISLVLIHPQEALNLIVILGGIGFVQFFVRRYRGDHPFAKHRPVYVPFAVTAATFAVWLPNHQRAVERIEFIVTDLLTREPSTLTEATDRSASLQALGGSFEELFLKLFFVSLLFALLAGIVVLLSITGRMQQDHDRRALIVYLTVGTIPVGILTGLIFIASQGDHYFRFLGAIMVTVGILGAVGLSDVITWLEGRVTRQAVGTGLVVLFVIFISLQAFTFHTSPYIYQPSKQVTHASMVGHATAFEHRDDGTVFMEPRVGPRRFVDAVYGRHTAENSIEFRGYREGVPGEVFNSNLSTNYDEDRYLALLQSDYRMEVELYNGLRYSQEGFESLESQPNISRLHDNGDFELYRINSEEDEPPTGTD